MSLSTHRGNNLDIKLLRPHDTSFVDIALHDLQALTFALEADKRQALFIDPNTAKRGYIGLCMLIEDSHQVVPSGVAIGIGRKVLTHSSAEGLLTHNLHQFFEHNGCFVVDNVAIHQARITQVIKRLANRCRTKRKILGKRRGGVALKPI